MTNPFSTTSTNPNFMCLYFDQLANMSLNNNHSRDVLEREFVVDNKSPCGVGVHDKASSTLSGSVDSKRIVINLSASQKYIKYTWFLTFTANHSAHPGLHFLHKRKTSKEQTLPNYNNLSEFEKKELNQSMEEL